MEMFSVKYLCVFSSLLLCCVLIDCAASDLVHRELISGPVQQGARPQAHAANTERYSEVWKMNSDGTLRGPIP